MLRIRVPVLQKNDLYFVCALALLLGSLACSGIMGMEQLPNCGMMLFAALAAHCEMLFSLILPDSGLASTVALLLRAALGGALAFSLAGLRARWYKYHHFIHSLRRAGRLSPAPEQASASVAEVPFASAVSIVPFERPFAFCYGLLRPHICASTGLIEALTTEELQAVLWHERHHQITYAPLRLFLADLVSIALFFLPVVREMRDLMALSVELAADRYAEQMAGRPALASALHRLLSHPLASAAALEVGMVGFSVTHFRIAALLRQPHAPQRVSTRSLLISTAVITLACLVLPSLRL